jgi:hypothetical protein
MSSTIDLHREKLIIAIFQGSGKDEERCRCFSKMVLNDKLKNTMNDMKAKLWIPICQRGHAKLFQLFIAQFSLSFKDISGGNGMILVDWLIHVQINSQIF